MRPIMRVRRQPAGADRRAVGVARDARGAQCGSSASRSSSSGTFCSTTNTGFAHRAQRVEIGGVVDAARRGRSARSSRSSARRPAFEQLVVARLERVLHEHRVAASRQLRVGGASSASAAAIRRCASRREQRMRLRRRRTGARRGRARATPCATTDCARSVGALLRGPIRSRCANARRRRGTAAQRAAIARDEAPEPVAEARPDRSCAAAFNASHHAFASPRRRSRCASFAGARSGVGEAQRFVGIRRQRLDEIAEQFRARRRAHADRKRQAGIRRDAVMRHAGRQIEHVAGSEHPFVRRRRTRAAASARRRRGNAIGAFAHRC